MKTYNVQIDDDRAQPALKHITVDYCGYVLWPTEAAQYFPAGSGDYPAEVVNAFLSYVESIYRVPVTALKIGDRVALRGNPKFTGRIVDLFNDDDATSYIVEGVEMIGLCFDKKNLLLLTEENHASAED